jgi:hypothetical protein
VLCHAEELETEVRPFCEKLRQETEMPSLPVALFEDISAMIYNFFYINAERTKIGTGAA